MSLSLTDEKTIKQAKVENIKNYMTGEAFSNRSNNYIGFAIEYYQRGYEWDANNVEDLLHTVFKVDAYEMQDTEIGNLIIQPINENLVSILDGQQRTTTLSFIILYLEQILQETILKERKEHDEALKHLTPSELNEIDFLPEESLLRATLSKMIENNNVTPKTPKLEFRNIEKYNEFYASLLKNRKKIYKILGNDDTKNMTYKKIIDLLSYSNKKDQVKDISYFKPTLEALWTISRYFNDKLEIKEYKEYGTFASVSSLKDVVNDINRLLNVFVTIEVFSVNMNPSIIFQNKNNKGRKLSPLDSIKNMFIVASSDSLNNKDNGVKINNLFKTFKDQWKEDNLEKYIYTIFKIEYPEITKANKIVSLGQLTTFLSYSATQENWNKKKTIDFLSAIEKKSLIYKKIKGMEEPFAEAKICLYILEKLSLIELYLPILMKFYPNEDNKAEKEKYLALISDMLIIYFIAIFNGKNNNYIRNNMMHISMAQNMIDDIEKGNSLKDFIISKLLFKPVQESQMFNKWEDYTFSPSSYSGILYVYECSLAKSNFKDIFTSSQDLRLNKNIQIEHIIPRSNKILTKIELDKIGNLVFLDKTSNEKAGNLAFMDKVNKVYSKKEKDLLQLSEVSRMMKFDNIQDIDNRSNKIILSIYKFLGLI